MDEYVVSKEKVESKDIGRVVVSPAPADLSGLPGLGYGGLMPFNSHCFRSATPWE
jgi:hypothetical protein